LKRSRSLRAINGKHKLTKIRFPEFNLENFVDVILVYRSRTGVILGDATSVRGGRFPPSGLAVDFQQ